ncbi:hypothetical protein AFB00_11775 [Pseudonocardia sp. HH130630-07]|nr:hypothetical protein AFB00_11775 [Pseudonocardia sp. HH130630-07]
MGAGERPAVVTVPAGGSGEPARAEPERVVPPLPEPGSAPKPRRFRRARGRSRGRGASVPARVGRNEAWRREGHRGRS